MSATQALDPAHLERLVRSALDEDIGSGDRTSESVVPEGMTARGVLLAKQEMVVAGLEMARGVFRFLDRDARWESEASEGDRFFPGTILATVTGRARPILAGERVALNFLQRLSGIATLTRRFVDAIAGSRTRIRDTRKTTPLLRLLEKHAVAVGGGYPHRLGLDSGVLVKDNHVRLAGSVRQATLRALAGAAGASVEVEVTSLEEVEEAIEAGAQMILLDNFDPGQVRDAVARIRGRVAIEVSGGVTLDNVREYAEAEPDFIAVGAITHSAPSVDISLEVERG